MRANLVHQIDPHKHYQLGRCSSDYLRCFWFGLLCLWSWGQVDELFFADRLPSPTFGTPGLLWAALTLALLNLPVVIVAVTEGLDALPNDLREASIALGATKGETVFRAVLPAALPSVFTG